MYSSYDYSVRAGTAPDAYGATILFTFASRILEISALDQSIDLQLLKSDGTLGDQITYDPSAMAFPYQIPFKALGFVVKNTLPGVTGRYQLIAWL